MYVVFVEELEAAADAKSHIVQSLEQAFAHARAVHRLWDIGDIVKLIEEWEAAIASAS